MIFISKVNQKLVSASADNVINLATVFFEVITVLRYVRGIREVTQHAVIMNRLSVG